MATPDSIVKEFTELHKRYKAANEKILVLQATAIEGIQKIGVGCITEKSRAEFVSLEQEINRSLARMREICESLH